jgi:Tol biopolymer transport system component
VEDIYAMRGDGSGIRALTNDGHSHDPSWSPDGQRILFIHDSALSVKPVYRETNGFESYHSVELFVMDKDGANRHLVRREEPVIFGAAWSPDGKMLAVSSASPPRGSLFLFPADGSGEMRLLFRNALTPAWSPDGRRLAFSVEQPRGSWAVHVGNADGTGDIALTDPEIVAGGPAWSPDGRKIAFDAMLGRLRQIFIMDADGSHKRRITSNSSWSCEHSSWSPDGKRLAFGCRSASMPCGVVSSTGTRLAECARRIFVISVDDLNAVQFQLGDKDGWQPLWQPAPSP